MKPWLIGIFFLLFSISLYIIDCQQDKITELKEFSVEVVDTNKAFLAEIKKDKTMIMKLNREIFELTGRNGKAILENYEDYHNAKYNN